MKIKLNTKIQTHLLPWKGIMEIGKLMTAMEDSNTGKHESGAWKSKPIEYHMDAAIRHYYEWYIGKKEDDESGLSPLAHMACRLLMALSNELTNNEIKTDVTRESD